MTPEQSAQVAECLRILRLGHTAGWLRSLGYAEGAIQAAQAALDDLIERARQIS